MSRPLGQLERALADLTIGVQHGKERRQVALSDTYTGEWEQQVQVALSGVATASWGFTDAQVAWELPFMYAPLQRMVPFETPHFTPGIEINQASDLLIVHAHVTNWKVNEYGWVVGASVRFAVYAPNASGPMNYQATAHLRFQGYAGAAEGDDFTQ